MTVPTSAWVLSGFGDEIDPDPRIQIAVLKALGASHIEVRSAWGTNIADLDDAQLDDLSALLRASNMGVSAIASPIGKVDIAEPLADEVARLRRVIRVAKVLRTPNIRVFSFFRGEGIDVESIRADVVEAMTALAAEAEKAGVVLLHENEKNIYGDTPQRVLDLIESVGSDALRVAWDSANFVQAGIAHPHDEGFEILAPYIAYLQVKDADRATGTVTTAGHGDGQVAETIRALRDSGYKGYVSLEPHLAEAHALGGFSGPAAFGEAARALADILREYGIGTR